MKTNTFRTSREMWQLFRFVVDHPMNAGRRKAALVRTLKWQLGTRLLGMPAVANWVEDSRLIVSRGMSGATGNLYGGLHEYNEMAFMLHFLRENELFVDIGANIGSYTVLAAKVCGAQALSFEPVPSTYQKLLDNIRLNNCSSRAEALNVALGERDGTLAFTCSFDTVNHVISPSDHASCEHISVPVRRLDDVLQGREVALMKIDVEGYESMVLKGACEALSRARALIVEVNGSGLRYGITDRAIAEQLSAFGYVSSTYTPTTRSLRSLTNAETARIVGNAIFVKNLDDANARVRDARIFRVFGTEI